GARGTCDSRPCSWTLPLTTVHLPNQAPPRRGSRLVRPAGHLGFARRASSGKRARVVPGDARYGLPPVKSLSIYPQPVTTPSGWHNGAEIFPVPAHHAL